MNNTHENELVQQLRRIDASMNSVAICMLLIVGFVLITVVFGLTSVAHESAQAAPQDQHYETTIMMDIDSLAMAP